MNKSCLLMTQIFPTNPLTNTTMTIKGTLSHSSRGPALCHPASCVGLLPTKRLAIWARNHDDLTREPSKFIRKIMIASDSKDLCSEVHTLCGLFPLLLPAVTQVLPALFLRFLQRCKHFEEDPSLQKDDLNHNRSLLGQIKLPIYLFKQNKQKNFHIKRFVSIKQLKNACH